MPTPQFPGPPQREQTPSAPRRDPSPSTRPGIEKPYRSARRAGIMDMRITRDARTSENAPTARILGEDDDTEDASFHPRIAY